MHGNGTCVKEAMPQDLQQVRLRRAARDRTSIQPCCRQLLDVGNLC